MTVGGRWRRHPHVPSAGRINGPCLASAAGGAACGGFLGSAHFTAPTFGGVLRTDEQCVQLVDWRTWMDGWMDGWIMDGFPCLIWSQCEKLSLRLLLDTQIHVSACPRVYVCSALLHSYRNAFMITITISNLFLYCSPLFWVRGTLFSVEESSNGIRILQL
ncbi:uncharacterized protein LOC107304669 [Oryza brachyantha]|uniref:uncharacterized protein LOC107304669 n=1 Tax=Oryza brachyantha TaxID=4533 RepID=UPI0007762594|nr:uncharacterized protein LOC107304669 [Oryza brachyantha]